jgi:hypothetical protein
VAGKGKTWVSIGVVEGKPQMITTPAHKVLLFPNEKGMYILSMCMCECIHIHTPTQITHTQHIKNKIQITHKHTQKTKKMTGEAALVELRGQRAAGVVPVPMDKKVCILYIYILYVCVYVCMYIHAPNAKGEGQYTHMYTYKLTKTGGRNSADRGQKHPHSAALPSACQWRGAGWNAAGGR